MAERGKHVSRRRGHLSPVVRIKSLSSRGQIETLPHLSDAVFLREDVVQIRDWYNRNSQSLKDEPGADRPPWFTEKVRIIEAERKFSAEAHEWQASIQHKRYHELEKNRRNRLEYFVQQAAHMEEPLSADELRLIPAFNRAITLGTPPTEPAWKALKGRLEKARSIQHQETQKLEAQQLSLDGWNSPPPSPTLEYTFSSPLYVSQEDEKEFLHRFSYLQEFRAKKGLISRLRKVEMYMKGNLELIQSPEAFVLVGLRLVWQGLQEVRNMAMWSPSLFPDSEVFWSDDVGDLTLEDAIVAYRELLRACSEMGGGDKSLLLRCPGCIGSLRSYHSLGNLLAHQVSSHSHEFSGFMRLEPAGPWDGRYLFRNVPWPANLPMLIPGIRQDAVAGEWSFDGPAHPIDFVVKGRVSIIRIDTRCHLIDRSIARLHHHGWQQQCGSGQ
ncbi:hypothetical protein P152DRAFT_279835 [Eremomyces bilateralis CBS 781.70]|uniref:Uncharacterized protein n=1 Tax=Eremomyces bilateralis CBS 781.70 TaxID=1392243 RepID=A0A6G1G905_9PEZI|nr:uncharacterized protein P152DRAFT_279835 [Eremomyces bilateralis CBS 781.70]KAF1814585.1 hypothetical protein P152DRAFT_279835 [Eremomyces bilateralis CBS 781.70]